MIFLEQYFEKSDPDRKKCSYTMHDRMSVNSPCFPGEILHWNISQKITDLIWDKKFRTFSWN